MFEVIFIYVYNITIINIINIFKTAFAKDLSEHLKHLGYPNNFPISALYTTYGSPQSFAIVADILKWLASCLESDTVLLGGISDETERILLIRSAAEFFVTKAGIKLNPRRLYASSAATAGELLKITTLLINAPTDIENDDEPLISSPMMDLGDKVTLSFNYFKCYGVNHIF